MQGFSKERLKGLEPSTFCMASRRSSQLSYSRAEAQYSPAPNGCDRGRDHDAARQPRYNEITMSGAGRAIAAAARAAARNKAVRGLALSAGAAAARKARPIAEQRYGTWRDRRVHKDKAIKLARQIGGRYSADTIIDGEPHFVVWRGQTPVQAFPPVPDLANRQELAGFDLRLADDPPPARRRPRRPPATPRK